MHKRNINPNGYDIIAFDCDSTLSAIEGIDFLAKKHNMEKIVEEITHKAMNGHSDFSEALSLRLSMVKPTQEDMKWLGEQYILEEVTGVKNLITNLKNQGKEVFIISGGFEQAIEIFANHIGVPTTNIFANELIFDDKGLYSGFDTNNPLSRNHGKKHVLEELAKKGSVLFVGDGTTDLEAKEAVDLFVGFGGIKVREVVKENADLFIEENSLDPILEIAKGGK